MISDEQSGFWKRVAADIGVLAVFVGMVWVIWQVVHSHYSDETSLLTQQHNAEIANLTSRYESEQRNIVQERDALRADLTALRSAYQGLYSKTEGLFDPKLFRTDTLGAGVAVMKLQGGKVGFRLGGLYGGRVGARKDSSKQTFIAFSYSNEIDSVFEDVVELNDDERWEYNIGGKRYYLNYTVLNRNKSQILVRTYELAPLYRPAGQSTNK